MIRRPAALIALLTLIFSILWLVFLIVTMATAGPLNTFDDVLMHLSSAGPLFYLTYLNAALVTLSATALYAALYRYLRDVIPAWATIGLVFVPAYCAMNLVVYLSQVTIVPELMKATEYAALHATDAARLLLSQLVQEWPASGMAFFNSLAYGLLGIPSIIYGAGLNRERGALRMGGILLALNGAACILGVIGILMKVGPLTIGSLVGGVLFIAALPFLIVGLRRGR